MFASLASNSRIVAAYREKTPGSAALAAEAGSLFPSGITHDSRRLSPYGIYVERAKGARKWDVDGNEYVDYFGGHGALLLGHNHPEVERAMHEALANGTHFGSNHPLEVRWAKLVAELIPSAERVRFTSSGTEATLLALRLSRAFTGKSKLVRFKANFHGWDGTPTPGVLPELTQHVVLLPPGDLAAVAETLAADDDVAAVILEPTGGSFGMIPLGDGFLAGLRELTARHGVILIFDEVITGFRVSRGGAQRHFGVTPDLTTLAKILGGGMPAGALAGRAEILELLDFEAAAAKGFEKVQHQGTYNANPVAAGAGVAALGIVATTDACDRANATAATLRARLNAALEAEQVAWAAYGTFSGVHIFTNPKGRKLAPAAFDPAGYSYEELKANPPGIADKLRLAMLINGVDISGWPGGFVSAVHDPEDVDRTADAFQESLRLLRREGEV
jgi:glutamate-1-semialdehyde 2,1-aminomutase